MNLQRLSVFIFLLIFLSGCKQVLYSGLTEKDANEMIAVLSRSGIEATKRGEKDDLYLLETASGNFAQAIEVLKEYGYPKEQYEKMGEVFKKEGLISSPLEERVRFIYALSQNVSETLMQIDGVIAARVHIVLPENNPFEESVKPSSASVFIKHHPEIDLSSSKSDVKLIVEKSIEGLTYDKVTVVMLPARVVGSEAVVDRQEGFGSWWWFLLAPVVLIVGFVVFRYILPGTKRPEADAKIRRVGVPLGIKENQVSEKAANG